MKISNRLGMGVVASMIMAAIAPAIGQAIQLSDGTVYFVRPPSLEYAATSRRLAFVRGATYYFTIHVPENAGEPLGRVVINQRDGASHARRIQFNAEDSFAFVGTRRDRSAQISIGNSHYDRDTQSISLTFDPPVPPNTTFTVALRPERNPQIDGVYLFGVTAFPAGEIAHGQFLGYCRIDFDSRGDQFPLF
jgi:Protein of unknown function (DUF2808)